MSTLERDMRDALRICDGVGSDLSATIDAALAVAQKHIDAERKASVTLLKSSADMAEESSVAITPSGLRNLAGTIESGNHLGLVRV